MKVYLHPSFQIFFASFSSSFSLFFFSSSLFLFFCFFFFFFFAAIVFCHLLVLIHSSQAPKRTGAWIVPNAKGDCMIEDAIATDCKILDAAAKEAVRFEGNTCALENVMCQAITGLPISMVVLGGSFSMSGTHGVERAWPDLVLDWFQTTFPRTQNDNNRNNNNHNRNNNNNNNNDNRDNIIDKNNSYSFTGNLDTGNFHTLANLAIGATSADVFVHCLNDMLSNSRPNLIFTEFAINDCGEENYCGVLVDDIQRLPSHPALMQLITMWRPQSNEPKDVASRMAKDDNSFLQSGVEHDIPVIDFAQGVAKHWGTAGLVSENLFSKYNFDLHWGQMGHHVAAHFITSYLNNIRSRLEKSGACFKTTGGSDGGGNVGGGGGGGDSSGGAGAGAGAAGGGAAAGRNIDEITKHRIMVENGNNIVTQLKQMDVAEAARESCPRKWTDVRNAAYSLGQAGVTGLCRTGFRYKSTMPFAPTSKSDGWEYSDDKSEHRKHTFATKSTKCNDTVGQWLFFDNIQVGHTCILKVGAAVSSYFQYGSGKITVVPDKGYGRSSVFTAYSPVTNHVQKILNTNIRLLKERTYSFNITVLATPGKDGGCRLRLTGLYCI